MRFRRAGLVPTVTIVIAACSSPRPEPGTATAAAAALPLTRPTTLAIGSVSPERLALEGDHVGSQTLAISFSIPDPSSVTSAQLKLYVGEIGDIATQTIAPVEHGTANFAIDPMPHSVGPTVRFRAVCPSGTTAWYAMGQIPYDYQERMAKVFRISNVTPESVRWTEAMGDPGAGQHVTLWGPGLPSDCRIEAEANGSSIELNNVVYVGQRYEGLLMYRDVVSAPVSPRYAELKLVITRNGQRLEAVRRVPFLVP